MTGGTPPGDETEDAPTAIEPVGGEPTEAQPLDAAEPNDAVEPDEADLRPQPRWWREVMIAAAFYLIYSAVRNLFGAGASSRTIAFRHARGVIKVEDWLGLWIEPTLQSWYLGLPFNGFIRAWNVFYGTAHFIVTIGVLIYAFTRSPARYVFARSMLAATTALALIGFSTYTLMPPRLLDANGPFGACSGTYQGCNGYEMVDTIDRWGGLWKFGEGGMADLTNQYAAMPSLHFGWSMWCAVTMILVIGEGRRRWLWLAYPAATTFCILITANHYWLDAVFGGIALAAGWLITWGIGRIMVRWIGHPDGSSEGRDSSTLQRGGAQQPTTR